MRAHLVQFDIAWEDPARNFERVAALLGREQVHPGDLVLLPEMFDTGFSLNVEKTADAGGTLKFLTALATDLKAFVQGGRTVRAEGVGGAGGSAARATNRATVIAPDGRVLCDYSKVHPFSFGREPERFNGGNQVLTYPWASTPDGASLSHASPSHRLTVSPSHSPAVSPSHGLCVCPAVCYDLRFPELFRIGLLQGAEVFALGANWPEARQAHWRALLIARAIENQAYVLGVNRTGRDPNLNYIGGSIAVGPRGEVLGELGPEERVLSVEVQPQHLHSWRETFPAWRDLKLTALRG